MEINNAERRRISIKPFFKWFDLWIGIYIDVEGKSVYVCPIPMFGVKIHWWVETLEQKSFNRGWRDAVEYIETHSKMNGSDIEQALQSANKISREI